MSQIRQGVETYLLFSIHPMTSLLRPSVFAASSSLRCVPFSTFRWSTKSSSTALPCAMNSSSLVSVFWIKLCSRSACCSRDTLFRCTGVGPRKGDSETSSAPGVCPAIYLRRVSPGPAERGIVDDDEPDRSSVRAAASCWVSYVQYATEQDTGGTHFRLQFLKLHPQVRIVCTEFLDAPRNVM